jgi:hypothetical protein
MAKEIKTVDLIRDSKIARLSHAIAGNLYYRVDLEDGTAYQFIVNMNDKEDVGTATFNAEEKAIFLTRYINKSRETGDLVQIK